MLRRPQGDGYNFGTARRSATGSAAMVQVGVQEGVGLVSAEMESLAWSSRYRIAFTAAVCRKPDKREQRRLQNPSPFDRRKPDRVQTR